MKCANRLCNNEVVAKPGKGRPPKFCNAYCGHRSRQGYTKTYGQLNPMRVIRYIWASNPLLATAAPVTKRWVEENWPLWQDEHKQARADLYYLVPFAQKDGDDVWPMNSYYLAGQGSSLEAFVIAKVDRERSRIGRSSNW